VRNAREKLGLEVERNAAIAMTVLVSALEALAAIAEHERTRHQESLASRGPQLKRPGNDDGDGIGPMLLFESAIVRTGRADNISNAPTLTMREHARTRRACRAGDGPLPQRVLEFDRNFRQDQRSTRVL
jgi:hypothetical protein